VSKSYAHSFMKNLTIEGKSQSEALESALLNRSGSVRQLKGGTKEIDLALPGNIETSLPSIENEEIAGPAIKLRRYHYARRMIVGPAKVTSASYGVDLGPAAFRALVERTSVKNNLSGHEAVTHTITSLLDRAAERRKNLSKDQRAPLSEETPIGTVIGESRGKDNQRVDDYPRLMEPNTADARQRLPRSSMSRDRTSEELRLRENRVKEMAQRKVDQERAAAAKKPKHKGLDVTLD